MIQRSLGIVWRLWACLPFFVTGLCYGILRLSSFEKKVDLGTAMVVESIVQEDSLWHKLESMVAAFGFYLKKLLIPFPQSFAIDSISPYYLWVGIIAILIILPCLAKRNKYSVILLFLILPMTPALLVAVIKFAFLPSYAERYLYMSSAFFSIGLSMLASSTATRKNIFSYLIMLLLVIYLPTSIQRNLLWADHLKLLESTNAHSLEDATYWNAYCIVLADREQYAQARTEYTKLLEKFPAEKTALINLAKMEFYLHDLTAARKVMEPFYLGEIKPDIGALTFMAEITQSLIKNEKDSTEKNHFYSDLIAINLKMHEISGSPDYLFTAAENALSIEDYQQVDKIIGQIVESYSDNEDILVRVRSLLADKETTSQ